MTREDVQQILEADGFVSYHVWTFWKSGMTCYDEYQCCRDDFENIEEALDAIDSYSGGKWDKVKEET